MSEGGRANLQGVDQILYEEQPAELPHTGVGVQQDFVGIFANLVLGQSDFHLQIGSGDKHRIRSADKTVQ